MKKLAMLKKEKMELEDRIKRLSNDVKCPLDPDFSEQATQLSNRQLLMQLLKVETDNLELITHEIKKIECGKVLHDL